MTKIQAQKRDGAVKVADVRLSGLVPGIVYGPGREPEPVSVSKVEFEKAFKEAGESTTISMTIDGKPVDVLIHDVQFDPVKNVPTHVDFYAVDMNRPIEVSVPIEYTGLAGAVKNGVGTLVKVLHELEVKALPKDLPHQIVIDIGGLDTLESQISAGEVALPSGVTLITKPGEIVASIAPLAKDEPTEAPVMDLSSIEVEKKGKREEAEEPAE